MLKYPSEAKGGKEIYLFDYPSEAKGGKERMFFDRSNAKMLKRNGFTLVEILVVISIIVFLSVTVLANYQKNSQQLALSRSAYKLSQDIRRAGEMAMSAKEFQGAVPQGGYGIYLKLSWGNFYKLYADTNGNEKYDTSDGEVGTVYLEKGIILQNIFPSSLSINFKPPNPTVKIKTESGGDSSLAIITLSLDSDSTKIKKVKVSAVGLTEIE